MNKLFQKSIVYDTSRHPTQDSEKLHTLVPTTASGNSKRMRMLEVRENKRSLKIDEQIVLSNAYLLEEIAGGKLHQIVSRRKKLPLEALDVWKYNRMRKNDIFLEPLVHGMCTDLHGTYMAEFPRMRAHTEIDEARDGVHDQPDEEMLEQLRGMHGVLDLNFSPAQRTGMHGVVDLNLSPALPRGMNDVLDLNFSRTQMRGLDGVLDLNLNPSEQRVLDDVPDRRDEEMQEQKTVLDDVPDRPDEDMQEHKTVLDDVPDRPDEEMQEQQIGLDDVPDRPDEEMQE